MGKLREILVGLGAMAVYYAILFGIVKIFPPDPRFGDEEGIVAMVKCRVSDDSSPQEGLLVSMCSRCGRLMLQMIGTKALKYEAAACSYEEFLVPEGYTCPVCKERHYRWARMCLTTLDRERGLQ